MGNCQAIDAATLVIQHPSGRVERFYWPIIASEVMKMNPGHYVALVISLPLSEEQKKLDNNNNNGIRFTRVKLLRPTDSLSLGHAYRLITSQEVMKGLWAKKHAKKKKNQSESTEKPHRATEKQVLGCDDEQANSSSDELENTNQVRKNEKHRSRTTSTPSSAARSRLWRPSLQSISEAAS